MANEDIHRQSRCAESPPKTRRSRRGSGRRVPSVCLPAGGGTETEPAGSTIHRRAFSSKSKARAQSWKNSCSGSKPKSPRAASSRALNPRGSTPLASRNLKSAQAKPAVPRPRWCCRTSPPVRIACARFSIRPIGATAIRSRTARIAARVSASSRRCLTTARTPR